MSISPLNLSNLPLPDVIETLDFEAIYDELVAKFLELWAEKRALKPELPEINTLNLETDPIAVVIQAWAYREITLRARVNAASKALMLATAGGADLENFAADFGVARRQIGTDADGNPLFESDEELRIRRNLAPDGYAAAGPENAYRYFALSAHGSIKEVAAIKGEGSRCDVILLGRDGDGSVGLDVIQTVYDALSPQVTRPLTDTVYVRSATITHQPVVLRVQVGPGPDAAAAAAKAKAAVEAYAKSRASIGKPLRVSGITAAAFSGNALESAMVVTPATDVDPGAYGAVHVPTVTVEVV